MTIQPNTVGAQPTAHYADAAHWAFYAALVFWVVGVLVDWAGHTVEGYAGTALGGVAMGVSVAYAYAHDWAAHRARREAGMAPVVWAPMSAAEARAALRRLAHAHVRRNRKVGAQ